MNWSVAKIGTIHQRPAHAIGLSAPPTPPIGCVLDLPGLPGGGNKIYDRSPYGNIGTITGATWKRLPSGLWYLDFDGSDDFVEIGDASTFKWLHGAENPSAFQFTIEMWVQLDAPTLVKDFCFLGTSAVGTHTDIGMTLSYWNLSSPPTLYMNIAGGAAVIWCFADEDAYPNDTGFHLVGLTYDQVLASANAKFYVDGVAKGDGDKLAGTPSTSDSESVLHIGSDGDGNYPMLGGIALPRIYNQVLSALEIQNHYQQEKHLFGVV